jgi:uncharacterized membrane protein YfcA
MPIHYLWLLPLGLLIGGFGTLIGAGGGFVLVPILLFLYPNEPANLITSISLATVFFNAASGSWAYSRMKRIDYKSGAIFAIAAIPGAILGAIGTAYLARGTFNILFGAIMILAAVFLGVTAKNDHSGTVGFEIQPNSTDKLQSSAKPGPSIRDFVDADGLRYRYAYNTTIGIVLSVFVGFLSSLLGVGGGFIHVPALTRLLHFPVPVAIATSQFMLAVTALAGTLVHITNGVFTHGVRRTAILAVGVVLGAQAGAHISNRVGGLWIIRGLAVALLFVGVRLIWSEM